MKTEILVVGDSLGGVLAAHTACQQGHQAVLLTQHPWIGGQLTSQAVPPDEHRLIERGGCSASYRAFRHAMHVHYRRQPGFQDTGTMTEGCNPGDGWVSRLCIEPAVAHDYLRALLQPHLDSGRLHLRQGEVDALQREGSRIRSLAVGGERLEADMVLDATETGELLRLAGLPYRLGKESQNDWGEALAPAAGDPLDQQPVTWVLALRRHAKPGPVIPRPLAYEAWRAHRVPHYGHALFSDAMPGSGRGEVVHLPFFADGATLDWWRYRRVVAAHQWSPPRDEVSLVNWAQNDYAGAPLLDGPLSQQEVGAAARELSLCLLHYLQTEADGHGYPELQPAPDVTGTPDGLAQAIYVRESRRLVGLSTLTQSLLSTGDLSPMTHPRSVGVAWYNLDIHPTVVSGHGLNAKGRPYVLPMGCFISPEIDNLLPACKNISATQLAAASTRVHPTEWLIGEIAALIASESLRMARLPRALHDDPQAVRRFQQRLHELGIPTSWDAALIETLA
ncbi:FAD-dependent oxidoreductase [Inhella sp.]|uniref:FAD-dependent oxidoreductase n=1 Tax=Inhella sp. TaxID=1921806 RepID=UPI0035AE440A